MLSFEESIRWSALSVWPSYCKTPSVVKCCLFLSHTVYLIFQPSLFECIFVIGKWLWQGSTHVYKMLRKFSIRFVSPKKATSSQKFTISVFLLRTSYEKIFIT